MYAIGDVHGRYDLFRRLMKLIAHDSARRSAVPTQLVLLGNILDFGPDSPALVRGCMALTRRSERFVVLKGNHEDMMADALSGDLAVYSHWLTFGGRETMLSWGVDPAVTEGPATSTNLAIAAETIGADVIAWLAELPLFHRHGDHLFVHAGIRPGIDLAEQTTDDLLWIAEDFLESDAPHEVTVVHGHSPVAEAVIRSNRIGIDTGAHRTGRLTALGIEDGAHWTLVTDPLGADQVMSDGPARGAERRASDPSTVFADEALDADLAAVVGPWVGRLKAVEAEQQIVDLAADSRPRAGRSPRAFAPRREPLQATSVGFANDVVRLADGRGTAASPGLSNVLARTPEPSATRPRQFRISALLRDGRAPGGTFVTIVTSLALAVGGGTAWIAAQEPGFAPQRRAAIIQDLPGPTAPKISAPSPVSALKVTLPAAPPPKSARVATAPARYRSANGAGALGSSALLSQKEDESQPAKAPDRSRSSAASAAAPAAAEYIAAAHGDATPVTAGFGPNVELLSMSGGLVSAHDYLEERRARLDSIAAVRALRRQ